MTNLIIRAVHAMLYPKRRNASANNYYSSTFDKYRSLKGYWNMTRMWSDHYEKTAKSIQLIDEEGFFLDKKNIKSHFKSPNYKKRIRTNGFVFDIYIYRLVLGDHPVRLEIHFDEGIMFYYKYTFFGKVNKNNCEKSKVFQIIKDKYLADVDFALNLNDVTIIDKHSSVLQIVDNVHLSLHYTNLKSVTFINLKNHFMALENLQENRERINELKLSESL